MGLHCKPQKDHTHYLHSRPPVDFPRDHPGAARVNPIKWDKLWRGWRKGVGVEEGVYGELHRYFYGNEFLEEIL